MAIQSSLYEGTSLESRTFPSTKHIATKAHMAVWRKQTADDAWVQMNISDYQLINNSCVLNTVISTSLYKQIEVRVGDTPDELLPSVSDIAIVASIADKIVIVSDNSDSVVTVSDSIDNVNAVAANEANVNIVGANIGDVNIVADAINGVGIAPSGAQFLGEGLIKAVQYMAQSTSSNIVVASGLNAFSVDSLTIEDGGSITIEDGAAYKIL
jgi:hypothetical protein